MNVPYVFACGNICISESEDDESEENENTKVVGRQAQRAESDEARLVLMPIIFSTDNRAHSPVNTRRTLMKKRSPNYSSVLCLFRSKKFSMRLLYLILPLTHYSDAVAHQS